MTATEPENVTVTEPDHDRYPPMCRPPVYGSAAWHELADSDPAKEEAKTAAADAMWELWQNPQTAAILAVEKANWRERRDMRESSWEISEAVDWAELANSYERERQADAETYRELRRRRGYGMANLRCDWKTCTADGTPHRSPQTFAQVNLCDAHSHLGITETVDSTAQMGEVA